MNVLRVWKRLQLQVFPRRCICFKDLDKNWTRNGSEMDQKWMIDDWWSFGSTFCPCTAHIHTYHWIVPIFWHPISRSPAQNFTHLIGVWWDCRHCLQHRTRWTSVRSVFFDFEVLPWRDRGQRQTKWRGFQITYTRLEPLPHRFAASDFDWWRRVLSRTFTYLPGFWQNGAIQDSAGARATWCRGRYYFPDRSSLLSLLSLYSFHLLSIIEFQRLICSARLI